ncbi:MAG: ATP-grasp domain-containing protein [Acetobacteraceae bacterium]|nr:ATP-grasp domain-containing protein [Acetobacteraceae bacterium]
MSQTRNVLIAAVSARALVAGARRAGFAPLAVDLFADADTQAMAQAYRRLGPDYTRGLEPAPLRQALAALVAGSGEALGLVYGSGFEHQPQVLAQLAREFRLLGNPPEVVARTKDPRHFAELCRALGIPHPEIRFDPAPDADWLEKKAGGAGGVHIRPARPGQRPRPGYYLQRRVAGRAVSAAFLADGREALVLFFSSQWAEPSAAAPFRFGGAVRPASLSAAQAEGLTVAVRKLAAALGLIGLNSADFLIQDNAAPQAPGAFYLLEINPRPGATFDLAGRDAFLWHLEACSGRLPAKPPVYPDAAASGVVYAPRPIRLGARFSWPDWCSDRPPAGARCKQDAPFCTVHAASRTPALALALLKRRRAAILARAAQDHPKEETSP